MKWPFIEYQSTGIYFGRGVIYLVTLSRLGNRVRVVSAGWQEIVDGRYSEALSELVERFDLTGSTVSMSADLAKTQISSKKLSLSLKDIDAEKWLDEYLETLLPQGMGHEDFAVNHIFTGIEEGPNFCNTLLIRHESIDDLVGMSDEAGVKVSHLFCASWTLGYAFLFEPSFVVGVKAVLSLQETPVLVLYKDGQFLKSIELESDSNEEEVLIEAESRLREAEASMSLPKNECEVLICISREHEKRHILHSVSTLGFERSFVFPEPLANINEGESVPFEYAPAAGMAMAGLYPDLNQVDLLTEQKNSEHELEIQKKDALNLVLGLGGVTFLLLLILNLYQWHLGGRLERIEGELLQVSDKITQISSLRTNVVQLRKKFKGAQNLVVQRTQIARMLDQVGEAVPSLVWLTEVSYNRQDSRRITIKGFTPDEEKLVHFLEALEKLSIVKDIRLNYSRSETAEGFQPEAHLRFNDFTLFQIQGQMAAS